MTVPNLFTRPPSDRDETLRAFALVLSLAGVGVAAAFATIPGALTSLPAAGVLALLAAALTGFALAARVWILPGWSRTHGVHAGLSGFAWAGLGFLLAPGAGVVPIVMGAGLIGAGLAALAVVPPRTLARRGA